MPNTDIFPNCETVPDRIYTWLCFIFIVCFFFELNLYMSQMMRENIFIPLTVKSDAN